MPLPGMERWTPPHRVGNSQETPVLWPRFLHDRDLSSMGSTRATRRDTNRVMRWLRRLSYLVMLVGSGLGLLTFVLDWTGRINSVIAHRNDPGWIAPIIAIVVNPPSWLPVGLVVFGLGFVWLDTRYQASRLEKIYVVDPERVRSSAQYLRLQSMIDPKLGAFSIARRIEIGEQELENLIRLALRGDKIVLYGRICVKLAH